MGVTEDSLFAGNHLSKKDEVTTYFGSELALHVLVAK